MYSTTTFTKLSYDNLRKTIGWIKLVEDRINAVYPILLGALIQKIKLRCWQHNSDFCIFGLTLYHYVHQ
ncbi:hypothetical protein HZS_151 [Henneguya salminicola]|nr:hypothetical protein HZS_151 [Henneguya salminicola]